MKILYQVIFLVWLGVSQGQAAFSDKAGQLGEAIARITETILGTSSFKAHLEEGNKFHSDRLQADSIVEKLADNIDSKLDAREGAVKKLRDVVSDSFKSAKWGKFRECCDYSQYDLSLGYDQRFLGKVDINSLCTMTSAIATRQWELPSDKFLGAALENMKRFPGLKSQYFGSDGGSLVSFPASRATDCASYDNRFRPWYVQASAPTNKDIVIMVDMSGSMEKEHRMRAAIHAATTILETLSPDDRVAVVGFSDAAFALGSKKSEEAISHKNYGDHERYASEKSCYDSALVDATPMNIHHLTAMVSKMVPHGDTNYTKGLQIAFDLLYKSFEREYSATCDSENADATRTAWTRERAIIFLSDGKPSDRPSSILDLIYTRNLEMHNSVVLLCYALGEGTFGHFIKRMSQQNHMPHIGNNKVCYEKLSEVGSCVANGSLLCDMPPPRKGFYRQVTESQYLRSAMGSYYNFFASTQPAKESRVKRSHREVTWSVPYFDAGGMGMVLTAATPVVVRERLVGVVGTDVPVSELMAQVAYFHAGGLASYAFLLDESGRVLLHPYMPSPSAVTDDPVLTDIKSFERDQEVRHFLQEILDDGDGLGESINRAKLYKFAIDTKRVLPQEHNSVLTRDASLTYTCTKVRHFVICVVLDGDMASHTDFSPQPKPDNFNFLYHRFDVDPPEHLCNYQDSVSSGTRSSVFLAPAAFLDAGLHMGLPEAEEMILLLIAYMSDSQTYHMGRTFKEVAAAVNLRLGIRDAVRVTSRLDEIWNANPRVNASDKLELLGRQLKHNVIYRYFSSENGVFRIHPGIQMPKMYNPVHRPWYEQARSYLFNPQSEGEDCGLAHGDAVGKCEKNAAVSAPYMDATGKGAVVTISQAVLAPVGSDASSGVRHMVGVMAGDVRLKFLQGILMAMVKECRQDSKTTSECILIDLAGYVIYDKALAGMNEAGMKLIVKKNYHISSSHRVIAEELVRQGVLVRRQCADVSKVAYHEEYKIDFDILEARREHVPFGISHVNFTNMVLLVMPKDFWVPQYLDQVSCIKHDASTESCERGEAEDCESPCTNYDAAALHYVICTNTFNYTWGRRPPPCVPDKFIDERMSIVVETDKEPGAEAIDASDLEDCFQPGEYAASDMDFSLFDDGSDVENDG